MLVEENKNLKSYTTISINTTAKFWTEPSNEQELLEIFSDQKLANLPYIVLGEGSNILFDGDYDGLVIHLGMRNFQIIGDSKSDVIVKVGAAVLWDTFVEWCSNRGWGGPENLSLIPGTVGASPVQNIGAYGSQASDLIESVEYFDVNDKKIKLITAQDCNFGYRESVFKHQLKGRAIITSVTYRLNKIPHINLEYADLKEVLDYNQKPSVSKVREEIIKIRSAKLPDPKEVGNCGSFFKNPVVNRSVVEAIQKEFPDLKVYISEDGKHKLPAAWLIDKCGFKGFREGNVGVHSKQALVLLAYDGATSKELLNLASKIQKSVLSRFNVEIEPEVNIIMSASQD